MLLRAVLIAVQIITRPDVPDSLYRQYGERAEFASVIQLSSVRGSGTGTLVTPRWVLTAGHVAARHGRDSLVAEVNGERILIRRAVYPQCGAVAAPDIALLELDHDVGVAPARIATDTLKLGDVVVAAGFGVGGAGARELAGAKRAGENRMEARAAPGAPKSASWVWSADFDVPGQEDANRFGDAAALPFEALLSAGDSGAGLFLRDGAGLRLVGVYFATTIRFGRVLDGHPTMAGSEWHAVALHGFHDWIESVTTAQVPKTGKEGIIC